MRCAEGGARGAVHALVSSISRFKDEQAPGNALECDSVRQCVLLGLRVRVVCGRVFLSLYLCMYVCVCVSVRVCVCSQL